MEPPLSRATNSIHLSRKKLTSFPGSLSYPSRSVGTGRGEPWDRNEVGKKLGNYGDDSGEPVKLFFFCFFFFVWQRGAENFIEIVIAMFLVVHGNVVAVWPLGKYNASCAVGRRMIYVRAICSNTLVLYWSSIVLNFHKQPSNLSILRSL